MKKKTLLYLKMIAFVVILVILDQISKFVATANLMGKSKYIVIKGLLSFNYLEGGNKGAAWGIFSGKILMFVIITIIAIVIISIFMRNITGIMCNEGKSATLMVLQYTFGMLMAGAVGNLIDRVVNGSVVDFICFEFIDFPIFNGADCYVTVSCVLIVVMCLLELLPDVSRSFIQKLLKDNEILLNDKPVKANYKVQPSDKININIPKPVEANIVAENIPLDIIYEDDDFLIVNKPKDMVVHPAPGHYTGTLVNGLMYHCKNHLSNINGVLRPGIVHRIDKDTTGALIICKNDYSHNFIAEQLKVHSITRKYVGIVQGVVKDESGTINAPIGRHPVNRKEMAINHKNGKEAVTHYKVLKRFDKYTFMEFQLETGRTHQIRVHMASIHHPLLGDTVYNHNKCPFKLEGQCLHAKTIGFIHPTTKEYVEFEAPIPEYMEHLLKIL